MIPRAVDDLPRQPDEIYGATVRSPIARGKLRSVRFDPSFDWSDVTALQAAELTANRVEGEQPILADKQVRHAYEPIVLLACADRAKLARAKLAVHLDIDPQWPDLDIQSALAAEDRQAKRSLFTKGTLDVQAELARCARVVTGSYSSHHQQPMQLRPRTVISWWDDDGSVHLSGGLDQTQREAFARALAFEPGRVELEHALSTREGTCDDLTIALHAALLAKKSGRPVRMVHERSEQLEIASRLPPCVCTITTGCDLEGTLRVLEMQIVLDVGAYDGLSSDAVSRAFAHATGPYRWSTVRIEVLVVSTHTPANRPLVTAQPTWAVERHLDTVARELGVDPLALRRKNVALPVQIEALAHQVVRRKAIDEENARRTRSGSRKRLGLGASLSSAITGSSSVGSMCEIAEVELDLDTLEVDVRALHIAAQVPATIAPATCKAQLEGAALRAIGWALCEQVVWKAGVAQNARWKNYLIATPLDTPTFHSTLVPVECAYGEQLGELPMGAAPAIAAAIEHAGGIVAHHLPLTPERLFAAANQIRDPLLSCAPSEDASC